MHRLPINIGDQSQLFFDNYLIEMVNFVTRSMHQPEKYAHNPILKKDKPWEIMPFFRTNCWNVRFDGQEQIYKCWYEDRAVDYEKAVATGREAVGHNFFAFHNACQNRMLYAESQDGVHWVKPQLDYLTIDGRNTNVCLGSEEYGKVHAFSVILDPIDSDPQRRFKSLIWHEHTGIEDASIRAIYSADGRTWHTFEEPVTFGKISARALGDVIIPYPDPVSGEYYLDTRAIAMSARNTNPKLSAVKGWGDPYYPDDPWGMTKRRVFSTKSRNFLDWSLLGETVVPDDVEDNLDVEHYGLTRFRIGDLWVGLLDIFHRTHNTKEVQLVYSRNGYTWKHVERGRPFLPHSSEGEWDCYMAEICNTPLFLDNEIRIYYGGANLHHDWWEQGEIEGLDVPEAQAGFDGRETALGIARLRPEGFVSIDSTVREGVLATRSFLSAGNQLVVNAQCGPKGYLEVELTDANDDVVAGFERVRCDPFRGDSTSHLITWGGRSELPRDIISRGAKIRFFSRHMSLYSFRIG